MDEDNSYALILKKVNSKKKEKKKKKKNKLNKGKFSYCPCMYRNIVFFFFFLHICHMFKFEYMIFIS